MWFAIFNYALVMFSAAVIPAAGTQMGATIPNFAPNSTTGWLKPPGDEFIQPESGPGPVRADPAHPYFSNAIATQETIVGPLALTCRRIRAAWM